mmetsp:Transcript_74608/g.207374  ORF Transcript_74608/g.207374 Transcript_74608/m.207374 type:complete len:235 (+) Transcript_74608:268-972(+)
MGFLVRQAQGLGHGSAQRVQQLRLQSLRFARGGLAIGVRAPRLGRMGSLVLLVRLPLGPPLARALGLLGCFALERPAGDTCWRCSLVFGLCGDVPRAFPRTCHPRRVPGGYSVHRHRLAPGLEGWVLRARALRPLRRRNAHDRLLRLRTRRTEPLALFRAADVPAGQKLHACGTFALVEGACRQRARRRSQRRELARQFPSLATSGPVSRRRHGVLGLFGRDAAFDRDQLDCVA